MKHPKFHLAILLIILLSINNTSFAQSADTKIANLLNQADWFALSDEYPKLKNDMQSEMLQKMSEAMIGLYFNQPQPAIEAIDWLLVNAQEEIGFENISNMILFKSIILGEQGQYADCVENINSFIAQVSELVDAEALSAHIQVMGFYEKMLNETPPEVIRPNGNTEIPFTIENVSRGNLMFVPVTIHGKAYQFIFDTGANCSFVSERFANEVGLRITQENFEINGVKSDIGKRGTIDSLMVGDIVLKNPNILIGSPNEEVDTVYQIDAVLGMDFIRFIGETQILPEQNKIVFPIEKTKLPATGRNLMFSNRQLYLKAYSKKEKLLLHFDTGNVKSDLYDTYYQKYKKEIHKKGKKKEARRGGYGGILNLDAYEMPKISFTVGNATFALSNVEVLLDKGIVMQSAEDGSLGMDFITLFKKVIINLEDMFLEVEK